MKTKLVITALALSFLFPATGLKKDAAMADVKTMDLQKITDAEKATDTCW